MKLSRISFTFFVFAAILLASACGAPASSEPAAGEITAADPVEADENNDDHGHQGEVASTMDHMHAETPAEFASLTNPLSGHAEAVEAGELVYGTNCAVCHGPEGLGDGPGAVSLDPKPATLADSMMMDMLSDGYLFWRVSKGGQIEPFNSAMPAWESILSEEQRWQVISYVRSLSGGDSRHMEGMHEHTDE